MPRDHSEVVPCVDAAFQAGQNITNHSETFLIIRSDGGGLCPFNAILTDRGSKYSVSGAPVKTKQEALLIIKALKKNKKYAKASHNRAHSNSGRHLTSIGSHDVSTSNRLDLRASMPSHPPPKSDSGCMQYCDCYSAK